MGSNYSPTAASPNTESRRGRATYLWPGWVLRGWSPSPNRSLQQTAAVVSSKEPLNDSSILVRTGQQIVGAGLLARLRHLCTIGDIMETLMYKCFE